MKALLTILVMHIGEAEVHETYPTQQACSEAMIAFAEADWGDAETWSQCRATYAPSTSPRPVARPW